MALSDATIKKFIKNGLVSIDPFEESNLTPAGYDLRAAQEVVLNSGEQRLAATLERVELAPIYWGFSTLDLRLQERVCSRVSP